MKHTIDLSVINTPLGIPTSADGVMMMFCKAATISTTFVLDTAYLLTSVDDLDTLGVTAATDIASNVAVYQQVTEFYEQAGEGAKLWLVGVAKATAFATYVAGTTFKNLIRGTSHEDPLNTAKMIGMCYEVPTALQSASDFPSDVMATLAALKTTQASLFQEGYMFSFIIDGFNMKSSATPSSLTTLATQDTHAGSICITGNTPNGVSAVGMALGRFARISIGHGFGAVSDGATVADNAYLTNGIFCYFYAGDALTVGKTYTVLGGDITYNSVVKHVGDTFTCVLGVTVFTTSAGGYVSYTEAPTNIDDLYPADIDSLGEKQFMFLRQWSNHSGYFWNDGATADNSANPLSTQEWNRVANSIAYSARSFIINTMGENVYIDKQTGLVDAGTCKTLQESFRETYIAPLLWGSGTGDISDGYITIVGTPNSNQVEWAVSITIVPSPLVGSAEITIEFSFTA